MTDAITISAGPDGLVAQRRGGARVASITPAGELWTAEGLPRAQRVAVVELLQAGRVGTWVVCSGGRAGAGDEPPPRP